MIEKIDRKSIKQCRCPDCDSPDFICNKKENVYECLRCGKKYKVIENNDKPKETK